MSFPNIPDITPEINIDRKDAVNLMLASIAFEEIGFSHIINAEAEKIQYILGKIEGHKPVETTSIKDVLKVNHSVRQILRSVIKTEMFLQFKLEDLIKFSKSTKELATNDSLT